MNVAIVGASGFLGTALTRQLTHAGQRVYAMGRKATPPPGFPQEAQWISYDVMRNDLVLPNDVDVIYYFPQSQHYREFASHADHVLSVNALGAVRLATIAESQGVRAFFYASTGNVYSPSLSPLSESAPLRLDNGYAISKIVAEKSLALVCNQMQLVNLRIFGLFGPGQTGMLVPKIIDRVQRNMLVNVQPSLGESIPSTDESVDGLHVSLCYVNDAVECLERLGHLVGNRAKLPQTLNLGGPEAISIRQLANEVGRLIDKSPRFEVLSQPRTFDLKADITRLTALISPRYTAFSEALSQTVHSPSTVYRRAG